ncbi:alpha/beta fold hydrolase [Aquimarina sp. W85]|uniref:alpha/beta fold hydrolase n=1 Tax=Aquimarina rhodophyticola TaxID=3342246 RepID=UPI0036731601
MTLAHKQININYTTHGQGKPIVFLHGFLENLSMWQTIVPEFLEQYQCIAIDLPGHGGSDNLGYVHSMETMAEVVKSVLETLKIDKAIIIGHSLGGYVGLAFAEKYTHSLLGLLLLNSTSFADSEERKYTRTRAIKIVKQNPNAYTSMSIANLFAPSNRKKYATIISSVKNQASKTSLQGILAALEGMKERPDRSLFLTHLKVPKCIISGVDDPVITHKQSQTESELTKTELVGLSGGHMSHIENYSECVTEIGNFVRKC